VPDKRPNLFLTIIVTGLIAGTIDILCAIFLLASGNAVGTLKYIASGVFGQAALSGESGMAALGLVFHYIIATAWTAAFILLYPKLKFLHYSRLLNAILYGLLVQTLMRFAVLPLTNVTQAPFSWYAFGKNAVILMFAIGLPAAFAAERQYRERRKED
jgi:hypothetical protein